MGRVAPTTTTTSKPAKKNKTTKTTSAGAAASRKTRSQDADPPKVIAADSPPTSPKGASLRIERPDPVVFGYVGSNKSHVSNVYTVFKPTKGKPAARTADTSPTTDGATPTEEYLSPEKIEAIDLYHDHEMAARLSRLDPKQLSEEESALIAAQHSLNAARFLKLRNRILHLWVLQPAHELTFQNIRDDDHLAEIFAEEGEAFVKSVYDHLHRSGYINYGCFISSGASPDGAVFTTKPNVSAPPGSSATDAAAPPKIIVLGAGIAGLSAARQLQSFGCRVVVMDPKRYAGGRILTYEFSDASRQPQRQSRRTHADEHTGKNDPVVSGCGELGAMIITGLKGNPFYILSKQLGLQLKRVKNSCPLFDYDGKAIDSERDRKVEREFNALLENASYVSHFGGLSAINGKMLSLGEALDVLMALNRKAASGRRMDTLQRCVTVRQQIVDMWRTRNALLEEINEKTLLIDQPAPLAASSLMHRFEIQQTKANIGELQEEDARLGKEILRLGAERDELEQSAQTMGIYLTDEEKNIFNWHVANLEFANAASVHSLSLKHWDQDDGFDAVTEGEHYCVRGGLSQVCRGLAKGLDIQHKCAATIRYESDGCKVSVWPRAQRKGKTIETADAVLVTLPLGVLKECAADAKQRRLARLQEEGKEAGEDGDAPDALQWPVPKSSDEPPYGSVRFWPPLPKWKAGAVERLGFGLLNKLVCHFPDKFWASTQSMLFGYVNRHERGERGRFFLFWSLYDEPTLVALISGDCANALDDQGASNDAIKTEAVEDAVGILRKIFGDDAVPMPVEAVLTHWGSDIHTRGTYSFVGKEATGDDYEQMALPITPSGSAVPRLFFAGEATNRQFPATIHGAFLSGLREAKRIVDAFESGAWRQVATAEVAPPH